MNNKSNDVNKEQPLADKDSVNLGNEHLQKRKRVTDKYKNKLPQFKLPKLPFMQKKGKKEVAGETAYEAKKDAIKERLKTAKNSKNTLNDEEIKKEKRKASKTPIIKNTVHISLIGLSSIIIIVLGFFFSSMLPNIFGLEEKERVAFDFAVPKEARQIIEEPVIVEEVVVEEVAELALPYKEFFTYEDGYPLMPHNNLLGANDAATDIANIEPLPLLEGYEPVWKDNLAKYPRASGDRHIVTIIINDVGIDLTNSLSMLDLPNPVGVSLLPGLKNDVKEELMGKAQQNNHELMMHAPLENDNIDVQSGVHPLLLEDNQDTILRKMAWNAASLDNFAGISHHHGTLFSENREQMTSFLQAVKSLGGYYIDTVTSPYSVGFEIADDLGVSNLYRDITLDVEQDGRKIRSQIRIAERIAKEKGFVVIVVHPFAETFQVLNYWMLHARARGFEIVPPSVLLQYLENNEGR